MYRLRPDAFLGKGYWYPWHPTDEEVYRDDDDSSTLAARGFKYERISPTICFIAEIFDSLRGELVLFSISIVIRRNEYSDIGGAHEP